MAKKITIQADIQSRPEHVWECWTQPVHITSWNYASDDWHCPSAENDLRKGGKYRARMEAKDGSNGFDLEAVYDEVVEGDRITYTMTDGRKVITDFLSAGGKTQVITVFEAETTFPEDMQRDGWQAILNNFKKYVEERNN